MKKNPMAIIARRDDRTALTFSKYQGLGNDFVIVDLRGFSGRLSPEQLVDGRFPIAKALCDRRYGIGADGVLTLGPATSPQATATMRVLNADGSEAEMCGNGLRCIVKYLLEAESAERDHIVIDTLAGPLACTAHWHGGKVQNVTASMGKPQYSPQAQSLRIASRALDIFNVSMGNPHAVTFTPESGEALRALATKLGPSLETHPSFPNRTNAEFAHIHDATHIELWVWERGCGITLACGTGACATAVAACLADHAALATEIEITLPGGTLAITVAKDYQDVTMRGPATHVFDGAADLTLLSRR